MDTSARPQRPIGQTLQLTVALPVRSIKLQLSFRLKVTLPLVRAVRRTQSLRRRDHCRFDGHHHVLVQRQMDEILRNLWRLVGRMNYDLETLRGLATHVVLIAFVQLQLDCEADPLTRAERVHRDVRL